MNKTKLLVIILVIVFIIIFWNTFDQHENLALMSPFSRYCTNCAENNEWECGKCANCGYCVNEKGIGSCVAGDENGPYFREDCRIWNPSRWYSPRWYPSRLYPYPYQTRNTLYDRPSFHKDNRSPRRTYDRSKKH